MTTRIPTPSKKSTQGSARPITKCSRRPLYLYLPSPLDFRRLLAGVALVLCFQEGSELSRADHRTKDRFAAHKIDDGEAGHRLCCGKKDAKDPLTKVNDTLKVNLGTNKIEEIHKFEIRNTGVQNVITNTQAAEITQVRHTSTLPQLFGLWI